jgi:DNA-binding NtrC family response regulator
MSETKEGFVPAHIVVVHDDPTVLHPLAAALRDTGHQADAYDSSCRAWNARAEAPRVGLLITRVRFPPGEPHGVALTHHARAKHPGVLILFAATAAEMAPHAEGLGARLSPTNPSHVATVVDGMLLSSAMKPDQTIARRRR